MSKQVMRRVAQEDKNYFWLEVEVVATDRILRTVNGGRLRTMMFPAVGVGMGMEFKLESDYLRMTTEKGNWKKGWPCGFVRIPKSDMSLLRHYMGVFKGTGRKFATSIKLNGTF